MSDVAKSILWIGGGTAAVWGLARWHQKRSRTRDEWGAEHDEDDVAPALDESGATSTAAEPARARGLSHAYDHLFLVHGMGLPVPYLRALAARESGLDPTDPKGLINVVRVVREDFNRRHHLSLTAADLTKPMISVMIAADALRTIIESFARHHPEVANLREDWSNRHFVDLLTYSWNAGWSESAGVGRVVRYLEDRGQVSITLADVVRAAESAGASQWLWAHPKKVEWSRSVADLYFTELARDVAAGRIVQPSPPPTLRSPAPSEAIASSDALDLGRPVPPDVRAIVSSGWSRPRQGRIHRALDIPVPAGTPVLAIADGTVTHVQAIDRSDAGIWLAVAHPSGLTSRYLHLASIAVAVGQTVRRGDELGRAGSTGNSEGPHVHLDLRASAALRTTVEQSIGTPAGGWGASLGTWGVSIPGEPFVLVDGYADLVAAEAHRAGIPLRTAPDPSPPTVASAEPVSRPDQVDDPVGG